MRRVRLDLAPTPHGCRLFDVDTGYEFGREVCLTRENMEALVAAAHNRPTQCGLVCYEQPLRVVNGEIPTRKEHALLVDVRPY